MRTAKFVQTTAVIVLFFFVVISPAINAAAECASRAPVDCPDSDYLNGKHADPALTAILKRDSGSKKQKFRNILEKQLDKPYAQNCNPPKTFHCSGLIKYTLKKVDNISVSSSVRYQGKRLIKKYHFEKITKVKDLQPLDIIYFYDLESKHKTNKITHVGVVWEIDGDTITYIHASSVKGKVVITKMNRRQRNRFAYGVRPKF